MKKNLSTPLRYPGGKVKIYNCVEAIIKNNFETAPVYIEPYCGGAGLALKLLFNGKVDYLILNDYDYAIYCFWNSILKHGKKFIKVIEDTPVNIEEWKKQKEIYNNQEKRTKLEIGFSLFFLNRCNRSGIIKAGPIGGKNQNGNYKIDCRYNKEELIERIKKIIAVKDKIKIYNMDAKKFIKEIEKYNCKNTFIYMDPPYINRGPELYRNYYKIKDHINIKNAIDENLDNYKWIVTYDDIQFVGELYHNYITRSFNINYSAGKSKQGDEIMIFSNNLDIPKEINDFFNH